MINGQTMGLKVIKWGGSLLGISAALMIALNLPFSGYGFVLFSVSALCWISVSWQMKEMSLLLLNIAFLGVDLLGIYRWLIV